MMRKQITLLMLVLFSSSAMAQAPTDLKPLAARTFTRSFNQGNVSLEYTLRAGPLMEPGKRRFIEIDIDTLMRDDAVSRGEFAIPLNGFIAVALPRGIEPDGELRMKFYNGKTGRYDFMYSSSYPANALVGSGSAVQDAVSKDVNQILSGLEGISISLDGSISFSGPQDGRLMGSDPDYAITGTSWLIPCNSLFAQLVNPFSPQDSIDYNPRLKATLPVRISESVANPQIMIYVGSLSTAVSETTVMSDAIPANVRLLEQPPVIDTTEVAPADAGAEEVTEPENGDAVVPEGDSAEVEQAPAVPPVPLRALQYSFGWAAWESEIDLSPVIIASALLPNYQPVQAEMTDSPINLDPPASAMNSGPITISAADSSERINPVEETAPAADEAEEVTEAIDPESVSDAEETGSTESAPAEDDPVIEESDEPDSGLEIDPEETGNDMPGETPEIAEIVPDDSAQQAAGEGSASEEAVPGSLAELKDAVEERRDRETGNSVNIDLPASAHETSVEDSEPDQTTAPMPDQPVEVPDEAVADPEIDNEQVPANPEPSTELPVRDDIPAFAFPEEIEAANELPENGEETDITEPAESAFTDSTGAEVREVEPGTMPGQEDMYSVPLKQITGRDGRQAQGNVGGAPDYTQLYIGGSAPGAAGGGTTPGDLGEMVFVPGGTFLMGTDAKASAGDEDERPLHEVEIDDFYIDKYPVTNRQFYQFVLSDGYKPAGNWQKYFEPGTADMPVRGVTWEDANAYCRWAGKRLPTEAEWEKAARGEDGRLYPWGDDWSSEILPRGSLNYRLVLNQKAASPHGALAMVGVLWQWTASSWAPYPYDPDANSSVKVLRGGAYSNGRNIIRCANRYPEDASVGFNTFTFRCARDKN